MIKKKNRPVRALLTALLAATAAGGAMATAVPITGLDPVAPYAVTPGSAPAVAQASFEAMLVQGSLQTESFQSYTAQPGSISGLFGHAGNNLATSDAAEFTGVVSDQIEAGTRTGRFSTSPGCTPVDGSGCNWWVATQMFTLTLDDAISAFGFYATDVGDFGGTLSISLFSSDDHTNAKQTLLVSDTGATAGGGQGGQSSGTNTSLLFFGFTDDSGLSYDKIQFNISQQGGSAADFLGFDDLMIGSVATSTQPMPEPGSLALVALSLVGLGITRRKMQR